MCHQRLRCLSIFVTAVVAGTVPVWGCPACPPAGLSITEEINQSDGAVIARWVSISKEKNETTASTTFQVVNVLKTSEKPGCTYSVKDQFTLKRPFDARLGQQFLLNFRHEASVQWGEPHEVDQQETEYITNLPPTSEPALKRLTYFVKYLEHSSELIAEDAYAEFAVAPYKDVAALTKQLPRNNIRKWVTSPETNPMHLGLYGLMLGLCGEKSDIKLMESIILAKSEDFRIGMDGINLGYLVLAGEPGLALLEKSKLTNKEAPFSEVNSAMQAMRLLWTFHPKRIPKPRMRQAMRLILKHPDYADLAILDLARWKDWGIHDQLAKLYDDKKYDSPQVKRAIIGYMLQSAKFSPSPKRPDTPAHVSKAKQYLDEIRARDPQIVESVEQSRF